MNLFESVTPVSDHYLSDKAFWDRLIFWYHPSSDYPSADSLSLRLLSDSPAYR